MGVTSKSSLCKTNLTHHTCRLTTHQLEWMRSRIKNFIFLKTLSANHTLHYFDRHFWCCPSYLLKLFVWGRPDRLEDANYTLEVTPTIQRYLREQLDMPYSLEKLGKYLSLMSALIYVPETYSTVDSFQTLFMCFKLLQLWSGYTYNCKTCFEILPTIQIHLYHKEA